MNIHLPLISHLLHIDQYLYKILAEYGYYIYIFLFLIIFSETGLIILPFLPGDSLLFAAGTLASTGQINLYLLIILLIIAAILGDTLNYTMGRRFSIHCLKKSKRLWFNSTHLKQAELFYETYGGKTIVIARFIPIIRTFAPFVAGLSHMSYPKFLLYNIVGATIWVTLICSTAYWFGHVEIVKNNFSVVLFGIMGLSIIPIFIELCRLKSSSSRI